jgi:LysM repeat protein
MGSVRRASWKPYLTYLAINVVVSAVTVLIVISIFGGGRRDPRATPTATVDVLGQVDRAVPSATPTTAPSPTPHTYTVRVGDTLSDIAEVLDVSVEALMEANRLTDANTLTAGQVLLVPEGEPSPAAGTAQVAATSPVDTPQPANGQVVINSVERPGLLEMESVRLLNTGGEVTMAGWRLEDGEGHTYTFPEFTFYSTGAIDVHTRQGTDTTIDLYWGLGEALWLPGKVISLRDANGAIQSTFKIP